MFGLDNDWAYKYVVRAIIEFYNLLRDQIFEFFFVLINDIQKDPASFVL